MPPPPSLRPPPPHSSWRWRRQLSSASLPKFALTLGITDPYLVLCCLKRLNTAHRVPDTFLPPCVHTHAQSGTVLEQTLVFKPPQFPTTTTTPSQRETAEVFECQQARVCLTFAKCHGILGSLHQQEAPRTLVGGAQRARCIVFHRGALLHVLTFGRRLV